jgi:hypothetical protein
MRAKLELLAPEREFGRTFAMIVARGGLEATRGPAWLKVGGLDVLSFAVKA